MSRRTLREALVGLVYLAVVVALISLSIVKYNGGFSDDINATVVVTDAGTALQKGSDVQVRGVLVGTVTGVSTTGGDVRLAVSLDRDLVKKVPADVTARLLPKTLFGERYVSLVVPSSGAGSSGAIASGDVIRQDSSAEAVELQSIFDRLLPVLQAVQPAQLATVLGTIAQTLRGRGTELGDTVDTLVGYLQKFSPQIPTLTGDLDKLADVAKTYSGAAPDLIDALDRFTTTSRTIVAQRDQFASTFATVITSSNTTSRFLGTNQGNIITLANDSLPVLQVLAKYSSEFPCIATALRDFVPVANQALGSDAKAGGLRVNLQIVPSPGKYVAGVDDPTGAVPAGGPSCPYVPSVGVSGTALQSAVPAAQQKNLSPQVRSYLGTDAADGIGPDNSPAENELIAELMAPTVGVAPSAFPQWGSLLLGPLVRGSQVDVGVSGS